jgi:uncharacterized protein
MDTPEATSVLHAAAERYAALLREALGDNLVSVVLFGSVARAEATADSDLDLLIICETLPQGRFARLRLLEEADRRFDADLARLRSAGIRTRVACLLKTRAEAARTVPLYLDMVEDARLLHDRDGFFGGVLARLRASLARLGAERRQRGHVRYWVLKREFTPGEVFEL